MGKLIITRFERVNTGFGILSNLKFQSQHHLWLHRNELEFSLLVKCVNAWTNLAVRRRTPKLSSSAEGAATPAVSLKYLYKVSEIVTLCN